MTPPRSRRTRPWSRTVAVRSLLARLPDWEADNEISGHDRPLFAPNLLGLLADLGVTADDDPRIRRLLDAMLSHQDEEGRFQSFGSSRSGAPGWNALLCDDSLDRGNTAAFWARQRSAGRAIAGAHGRRSCRPGPGSGLAVPGRSGLGVPRTRTKERLLPPGHPSGPAGVLVPAGRRAARVAARRGSSVAPCVARTRRREALHVRPRQAVQAGQMACYLVQLPHGARCGRALPGLVDRPRRETRGRQGDRRTGRLPHRLQRGSRQRYGDAPLVLSGFRAVLLRPEEAALALRHGQDVGRAGPGRRTGRMVADVDVLALASSKGGSGRALAP